MNIKSEIWNSQHNTRSKSQLHSRVYWVDCFDFYSFSCSVQKCTLFLIILFTNLITTNWNKKLTTTLESDIKIQRTREHGQNHFNVKKVFGCVPDWVLKVSLTLVTNMVLSTEALLAGGTHSGHSGQDFVDLTWSFPNCCWTEQLSWPFHNLG